MRAVAWDECEASCTPASDFESVRASLASCEAVLSLSRCDPNAGTTVASACDPMTA